MDPNKNCVNIDDICKDTVIPSRKRTSSARSVSESPQAGKAQRAKDGSRSTLLATGADTSKTGMFKVPVANRFDVLAGSTSADQDGSMRAAAQQVAPMADSVQGRAGQRVDGSYDATSHNGGDNMSTDVDNRKQEKVAALLRETLAKQEDALTSINRDELLAHFFHPERGRLAVAEYHQFYRKRFDDAVASIQYGTHHDLRQMGTLTDAQRIRVFVEQVELRDKLVNVLLRLRSGQLFKFNKKVQFSHEPAFAPLSNYDSVASSNTDAFQTIVEATMASHYLSILDAVQGRIEALRADIPDERAIFETMVAPMATESDRKLAAAFSRLRQKFDSALINADKRTATRQSATADTAAPQGAKLDSAKGGADANQRSAEMPAEMDDAAMDEAPAQSASNANVVDETFTRVAARRHRRRPFPAIGRNAQARGYNAQNATPRNHQLFRSGFINRRNGTTIVRSGQCFQRRGQPPSLMDRRLQFGWTYNPCTFNQTGTGYGPPPFMPAFGGRPNYSHPSYHPGGARNWSAY
jgi:hypothetical protein